MVVVQDLACFLTMFFSEIFIEKLVFAGDLDCDFVSSSCLSFHLKRETRYHHILQSLNSRSKFIHATVAFLLAFTDQSLNFLTSKNDRSGVKIFVLVDSM